jgi:hypothetical protein
MLAFHLRILVLIDLHSWLLFEQDMRGVKGNPTDRCPLPDVRFSCTGSRFLLIRKLMSKTFPRFVQYSTVYIFSKKSFSVHGLKIAPICIYSFRVFRPEYMTIIVYILYLYCIP